MRFAALFFFVSVLLAAGGPGTAVAQSAAEPAARFAPIPNPVRPAPVIDGADAADEDVRTSLLGVEARVGQGLAMGGGPGNSTMRLSPLWMGVLVDYAINEQPWTTAWGAIYVEGDDRGGVGLSAGLRVYPGRGDVRAGLGVTGVIAPYTIVGPMASLGRCWSVGETFALCGDVEAAAFVFGNDLPDGRIASQIQGLLGVRFDAL